MNRNSLGVGVALCLMAGHASADFTSCVAEWTTACAKTCTTSQCVSNCTTQAQNQCAINLAAPQQVFSGPVTAAPVDSCTQPDVLACAPGTGALTGCSNMSGTVADKAAWGGLVTIYVICPNAQNASTTVLGSGAISIADGSFSFSVTNACGGRTGCYGLFAVTSAGDPTWSTCTSSSCPTPFF